tara:strand:+ start:161 stop:373 length:213 start_codon:yes stop_codon:yes gene_type:complete
MTQKGYTFDEYIEGGKLLASEIKKGNFPIEGTTEKDYMIIGEVAVYKPYFPLYTTPSITDKDELYDIRWV